MRKLSCLLFVLVFSLWAADFWQTKPFTAWGDKDVQKMMNGSPWARQVSVAVGTPSSISEADAGSGGRGARRGIEQGGVGDVASGVQGIAEREGRGAPTGAEPIPSTSVVIRWQTARPMKQAVARAKYGSEVASSPEAKKFLEREETNYIVSVSGLPATIASGDPEKLKTAVKGRTTVTTKGRDSISPAEVEIAPQDTLVDVYFVFPRTTPFTLDDKEVEFSTRIGAWAVRYKFRLKDMVFNGKLEL